MKFNKFALLAISLFTLDTTFALECGKSIGSCPKNECCSQYGYCGQSEEYCGAGCQSEYGICRSTTIKKKIIITTPNKVASSVSTDGKCGPKNGKACPSGQCCSKWGYCGTKSDFCGEYCLPKFGKCNGTNSSSTTTTTIKPVETSTDGTCGPLNGKACPSGQCCSKWGYCGTKSEFCGEFCLPDFGKCDGSNSSSTTTIKPTETSTDGTCGPLNGKACPSGQCCSKWGYCGTKSDFCGEYCLPDFGKCDGSNSSSTTTTTTTITTITTITTTTTSTSTSTPTSTPTNVSTNGLCGANNGNTICPNNQCCNNGFCKFDVYHCKVNNGCQSNYGYCLPSNFDSHTCRTCTNCINCDNDPLNYLGCPSTCILPDDGTSGSYTPTIKSDEASLIGDATEAK